VNGLENYFCENTTTHTHTLPLSFSISCNDRDSESKQARRMEEDGEKMYKKMIAK
jgi:hypothetical protein